MKQQFHYAKTFLLGFGFLGISLIWPIFNNYVPVFLRDRFGLSATLIGFIMTTVSKSRLSESPDHVVAGFQKG